MKLKCAFLSVLAAVLSTALAAGPMEILPPGPLGWPFLSAPGQTGMVYTLQASTNLAAWSPIATAHDGLENYPDAAAPLHPMRFYRLQSAERTDSDDWKNQIRFPDDLFQSSLGGVSGPDFRWVKFVIRLDDPFRVYFQDSQRYSFHYDFASARLEPFKGMSPAQFDQVALRTNQQQALLGTVLFPPWPNDAEFGIQFVGQDAFPPEFISRYFDLVKATVAAGTNVSGFYLPAYEQARVAELHKEYFEARGIRLASAERWLAQNDVYSTGWALGRLKYFPGSQISAAFADGRLLPQDILLTDGVPAEIPILAGVLTLTPSTPNSHVAILAKSFGIPFAWLSDTNSRAVAQALVGKDILLRIDPYGQELRVTEIDGGMDPAVRAEILGLKAPPVLSITPKAARGAISASTDNLTPADIQYFGGKAANYGFLRREIPNRSQAAIGISFDLWDAFMEQALPSGRTLREEIHSRLSGYTYPANLGSLKQDLAAIRELITGTAKFTDAQKQEVIAALGMFDRERNIRFRSSTNVEDSEQFSGAGLYDSYSGCLLDDLDGDNQGPSACDPTEKNERGVFRAIQKVYASFYNDNAFIERLRHQVDESKVGMAMLVHHSVPDEFELANGVAALLVQPAGGRGGEISSVDGNLVTQKGAVSVTNPDSSAKPEVVQGYYHQFGAGAFLQQRSSLVPLGAYVLEWQKEYVELMNLFAKVGKAYHAYFPAKQRFTLDFEYKKVAPGVLDIKQVREVPNNQPTNNLPAYLIHEANDYVTFQGEAADIFSNHRLKSFWNFHVRNMKFSGTNLAQSIFASATAEHLGGGVTNRLSGSPASWPNASHEIDGDDVLDRWEEGTGADRRSFELRVETRASVTPPGLPVFTLPDLLVQLSADYETPQPALGYDFDGLKPVLVKRHTVTLAPRRPLTAKSLRQDRRIGAGGVTVNTSYFWPAPPSKGLGEKTAPLVQWVETRIEGLTAEPIILRGEYSQTYRPGHHNFSEEFIFEPALEETLSWAQREALAAANVKLLHVQTGFMEGEIRILGLDGEFRTLK